MFGILLYFPFTISTHWDASFQTCESVVHLIPTKRKIVILIMFSFCPIFIDCLSQGLLYSSCKCCKDQAINVKCAVPVWGLWKWRMRSLLKDIQNLCCCYCWLNEIHLWLFFPYPNVLVCLFFFETMERKLWRACSSKWVMVLEKEVLDHVVLYLTLR